MKFIRIWILNLLKRSGGQPGIGGGAFSAWAHYTGRVINACLLPTCGCRSPKCLDVSSVREPVLYRKSGSMLLRKSKCGQFLSKIILAATSQVV